MNYIIDSLRQTEEYKRLLEGLGSSSSIYLHGMVQEANPHLIYALAEDRKKNILIITEDDIRSKEIISSLSGLPKSSGLVYPSKDIGFQDIKALESQVEQDRIQVMNSLISKETNVVAASVSSLVNKISTPHYFKENRIYIDTDSLIDLDDLAHKLSYMQYDRVTSVSSRGEFSIRGGIIDIFPIDYENPVRLELFDREVDSIRSFSIADQRSVGSLDFFSISPAREFLFTKQDIDDIKKGLEKDIGQAKDNSTYGVDQDKLISKYSLILEIIQQGNFPENPSLILPYIKEDSCASLLDYLSPGDLVIFEDLSRIYDRGEEVQKRFALDVADHLERGELFESGQEMAFAFSQLLPKAREHPNLNVNQLKKRTSLLRPDLEISLVSVEAQAYNRNMALLLENIKSKVQRGYKIVLMLADLDRAQAFKEHLQDFGVVAKIQEDLDYKLEPSDVLISTASFSQGFEYPVHQLSFITAREIYGKSGQKPRRQRKSSPEDLISYSDLDLGDYVVHENHGIGLYRGLERMEVGDTIREYLVLEYQGKDKLYIPTEQMDLVQKYLGEGRGPALSKLGSAEWQKTKARTKKALEEIAQDLVEIYARREEEEGFAFSADSPWQQEFEDSFPYQETPAQLRAIGEIKKDMEASRPMERLLCGDVGYGKTEVAFRAAFKAIMDGKQVALLVPTTILAQQHYHTALERFKNFPVKVDLISRFRTAKEQKLVLEATAKGQIDLLIGTHRLLSQDLYFDDLGLLIVDEEQRFGVRHKDKLKALRENIDLLHLSATPIPRTMQMGLVGIRDMSILDDPPEHRHPTTTYVTEFEPMIIRDAILREMTRGGQIYFVHNRVADMDLMLLNLRELVPEADIVVGHGQMSERQLEKVMEEFARGQHHILLSTSIIETGMDIENVNTMIIYGADKLGLSQLYQLKGRIGRGDRSSYAYFTYEADTSLSEISEKRLKAIRDFTEFGAGFKIAMRDLELRGAGNLLGESQSGHIESIGYELYVKYMKEAITRAKGGQKIEEEISVQLDLDQDTYISENYIPSGEDKLDIYKRIAIIETREEFLDISDELMDRYGDMPQSVINVLHSAMIKNNSAKLNFHRVVEGKGYLEFFFKERDEFSLEELKLLSDSFEEAIEFNLSHRPSIKLRSFDSLEEGVDFLIRAQDLIKSA